MATRFYIRNFTSPTLTAPSGSAYYLLSERSGHSSNNLATTTTAGGTAIDITLTAGGTEVYWFTEPVTTAVTISDTITVLVRALESATTVNACIAVIVERTDNSGSVISTILDATVPDPAVELSTGAVNLSDTYTPTTTSLDVGDRIKVTVQVRNVGMMGAGTVTVNINAQTTANGSAVEFAEDIVTDQPVEVGSYEIYGSNGYRR